MNTPIETEESLTFRVSDLKQYVYCPRVAYYQIALPDVRPTTYKMERGIAAGQEAEGHERRRSLRAYGLSEGERSFGVRLASAALGLSGEMDMVIETADERIPVDYKLARQPGPHYKLQLTAYARLLETVHPGTPKPSRRGFLYLIPERRAVEVRITDKLWRELDEALADLWAIARTQRMPPPTERRARCVDCEFRRFCNDVA